MKLVISSKEILANLKKIDLYDLVFWVLFGKFYKILKKKGNIVGMNLQTAIYLEIDGYTFKS